MFWEGDVGTDEGCLTGTLIAFLERSDLDMWCWKPAATSLG